MPEHFAEVMEQYGVWTPALEVAYVRSLQIRPVRRPSFRWSPEPARVLGLMATEPGRWWTFPQILGLSVLRPGSVKSLIARMVADGRLERLKGKRETADGSGGRGVMCRYRVLSVPPAKGRAS